MDNKSNVGSPDRDRISLTEDYEVRHWTAKFGVSREQLKEAVDAVGHSVEKVASYFEDNTRPQQGGEAGTTRFGMEDGDNTDTPATGVDADRQSRDLR